MNSDEIDEFRNWDFGDRIEADQLRNAASRRSIVALTCSLSKEKLREQSAAAIRRDKTLAFLTDEQVNLVSAFVANERALAFFDGACGEADRTDDAIQRFRVDAGRDSHAGYRWFMQCVGNVCESSIAVIRESVRTDRAHHGRMGQREDTLRSSILHAAAAWERRGDQ